MMEEFFFHVLFFLCHIFKVRCYNAAYIFIFRCSLSHHSLIPSILLLSASRYFADTVYPYIPSLHTFDHLYSQSRGKFTAYTPTSCISSLHLEVYKWMRGLRLCLLRLSWDHLAHLIKHRGFNLVFGFSDAPRKQHLHHRLRQSAADSRHTHTHTQADAPTHTETPTHCRPGMFINDIQI